MGSENVPQDVPQDGGPAQSDRERVSALDSDESGIGPPSWEWGQTLLICGSWVQIPGGPLPDRRCRDNFRPAPGMAKCHSLSLVAMSAWANRNPRLRFVRH